MILQCRVKPGKYQKHNENVWTVSSHEDIRTYAIILGLRDKINKNNWIEIKLYIIIFKLITCLK